MKHAFLLSILFIVNSAMGQNSEAYEKMLSGMYKNTVPVINANQLSFELSRDTSLVILDAREPAEYQVSHLPHATCVGYNQFALENLPALEKHQKIIVYCSVGYRSERIGEKLLEAGFTNVHNLHGGIFEWVNKAYPVYHSGQITDSVHAYDKEWGKWLMKGVKVYE